jgi:hypothetical protein
MQQPQVQVQGGQGQEKAQKQQKQGLEQWGYSHEPCGTQ